ncbi:hypothetical protein [Streptomyces mirabilis]|uniref:hypothetical protein n=1 Tax=Streptomyces mirabilis TaxID=68239 RepID=UPI0033DD733E
MTGPDHYRESERLLKVATESPSGSQRVDCIAAAQVHATLADRQDPVREQLATLLDRWQEVADAYKPGDLPWDDTTRRYRDYRLIYLRNIRDLRHLLDTGQIPCSLMTDEERRRGDCGQVHDDAELEQHGTPEETAS